MQDGDKRPLINAIFVLKDVRAKWPNPELVSRGAPLSNSLLLRVPGSLVWEKMKKIKAPTRAEMRWASSCSRW